MSESSGQFGIVERSALAVASVLVLFGAVGIWQRAHDAADAGRDFALTNVLFAGVVLAIGTLAASAYRSRSQIDIDRLERAVSALSDANSKIENVNKLLIEARKLADQAGNISDAYGALKSELEQVGRHATSAAESQDSISKLTSNLRDLFLKDEAGRKQFGGSAAASLMTQWELGNASWNGDRSTKALARAAYYQKLKETVLVDGALYPTPCEDGWADCIGEFVDLESDRKPGTIVEVASYQWRSASHDGTVGRVKGMKSKGVGVLAAVAMSGESIVGAASSSEFLGSVPIAGSLEGSSVETATKGQVLSNEETKV